MFLQLLSRLSSHVRRVVGEFFKIDPVYPVIR